MTNRIAQIADEMVQAEKMDAMAAADERVLRDLGQAFADLRLNGEILQMSRDLEAAIRQRIKSQREEANIRKFAALREIYEIAE